MMFGIDRKLMVEFSRKRSYLKRIRSYDTGEVRDGSRHSLAR